MEKQLKSLTLATLAQAVETAVAAERANSEVARALGQPHGPLVFGRFIQSEHPDLGPEMAERISRSVASQFAGTDLATGFKPYYKKGGGGATIGLIYEDPASVGVER